MLTASDLLSLADQHATAGHVGSAAVLRAIAADLLAIRACVARLNADLAQEDEVPTGSERVRVDSC